MRPSLRFLGVAVLGWAGVRAAALGVLPGAELFRFELPRPAAPPIVPTQFPTIEPVASAQPMPQEAYAQSYPPTYPPPYAQYYAPAAYPQPPVRPVMVPVYYAAPISAPVPRRSEPLPRPLRPLFDSSNGDEWPLPRLAAISTPARSSVVVTQQSMPAPPVPPIDPRRLDRLQLTSWAYLRSQQTGIAGSRSLATGGQLGASQAGARLIYNFNRQLALAARFSSEVGRRGGEAAAGVRVRPLAGIPVWVSAERRQALGRYGGGRSAFAFFAEGGLYEQPLPWRFSLDPISRAALSACEAATGSSMAVRGRPGRYTETSPLDLASGAPRSRASIALMPALV